jgi:hypothetical protein
MPLPLFDCDKKRQDEDSQLQLRMPAQWRVPRRYMLGNLLVTALLSSILTLYFQAWVSTSNLPRSLRRQFQPLCTYPIVDYTTPPQSSVAVHSIHPFNYGLKQCGALVIEELTSIEGVSPSASTSDGPDAALNGDTSFSQCWEFHGHQAQLGFSLVELLKITSVSIRQDISDAFDLAPRSLILWGLIDGQDAKDRYRNQGDLRFRLHSHLLGTPSPSPEGHDFVPLAYFQFNPYIAESRQFGSVFSDIEQLGIPFGIVVLQILDNWGAESTRLCGVGIHGIPWGMNDV